MFYSYQNTSLQNIQLVFVYLNKYMFQLTQMKWITSRTFLTFFLPPWPSPLAFDSWSYHDRNTGNKVCLGMYTYITKVVCSSRNPCYQFCIKDIRKSYSIPSQDIYIYASRFIYFRQAEFEETNYVLQYITIIKHSLFLSWEECVWVNVSHTQPLI